MKESGCVKIFNGHLWLLLLNELGSISSGGIKAMAEMYRIHPDTKLDYFAKMFDSRLSIRRSARKVMAKLSFNYDGFDITHLQAVIDAMEAESLFPLVWNAEVLKRTVGHNNKVYSITQLGRKRARALLKMLKDEPDIGTEKYDFVKESLYDLVNDATQIP